MNFNGILLTVRPSFVEWLARIVDIGGTLNEYNTSLANRQADYLAIAADWQAVGDAIRKVGLEYASDPTIINEKE